jgi:hypothetical protein
MTCEALPEWQMAFEMDTFASTDTCLPAAFDLGGGVTATVS